MNEQQLAAQLVRAFPGRVTPTYHERLARMLMALGDDLAEIAVESDLVEDTDEYDWVEVATEVMMALYGRRE